MKRFDHLKHFLPYILMYGFAKEDACSSILILKQIQNNLYSCQIKRKTTLIKRKHTLSLNVQFSIKIKKLFINIKITCNYVPQTFRIFVLPN